MEQVLGQLAVVLFAALLAAELSERVRLPSVVGEIVAGVVVGPSVLRLVNGGEVLHVLGELGVIVLLLEVGMHMDLGELAAVGGTSLRVAVVGVVVPFVLGYGAAAAVGMSGDTAVFLGAALTATSVGITARVFGDLRALASVEARTVLGAAVADDVLGLVVLTVVVRVVSGGQVTAGLVLGTVGLAVGFIGVVGAAATVGMPRLFALVSPRARSATTLVVLALAVAFGLARLAAFARLAPIIGAFVAGLALARIDGVDDVRREIRGIGHLLIPVFFLQIGVSMQLGELMRPRVLAVAALLIVAAAVGKLVAGFVVTSGADRLLIGIGMLPRGEVGLVFATIGLQQGVLGADAYAALLVVVLTSTLVTPALLRARLTRLRSASRSAAAQPMPAGGWLATRGGVVDLLATPPERDLLEVGLLAARACAHAVPGPRLLDWLTVMAEAPVRWAPRSTQALFDLLREGDDRSWRLVEVTGLLDRALPELAATVRLRRADPTDLDPAGALRWRLVDDVHRVVERDPRARAAYSSLRRPEWLLLAALVAEAAGDGPAGVVVARRLAQRFALGAAGEQHVAALVGDRRLLTAAAKRIDALSEATTLELAVHLSTIDRLRALQVLSIASDDVDPAQRVRLDALAELVAGALERPDVTSRAARNDVEAHRAAASRLAGSVATARQRVATAPRLYILRHDAAAIARHAGLVDPVPQRGRVRVHVREAGPDRWDLDVVSRDAPGLLARVSGAITELGLDIADAVAATWPDGAVIESFRLAGAALPAADVVQAAIQSGLAAPLQTAGVVVAEIGYDDAASPWHTICEITAPDRPGLLHSVAGALASAGVQVHTAQMSSADGSAHDVFALTDRRGEKLDDRTKAAFERALRDGVQPERRGLRRWRPVRPAETPASAR